MSDTPAATPQTQGGEQAFPPPHEWNAAVAHSIENHRHVLGPYDDLSDGVHMECSCGWDSADVVPAGGDPR